MKPIKLYSQEERERILEDYQKSGLSPYKYCKNPEVIVSATTINRWLQPQEASKTSKTDEFSELEQLGMVCYTVEATPTEEKNADQSQRLPLEQMVSFHRQVYECCCTLQELACTAENADKIKYIMGVL